MSSGFGRCGGLGLVRENSCGLVVLIGAFLTWPPQDTASASCFMRILISGRHLKDKQTHSFLPFYLWNNNTLLQKILLTSAEGQSSFSHIFSVVDRVPFRLYPCGEVCEEEIQELQGTVTELLIDGYFQYSNRLSLWSDEGFLTVCIFLMSSDLTMLLKRWSPRSSRANVAR